MSEELFTRLTFSFPEEKSVLTPVPGFEIRFAHTMPNWWWRFWQFVLLGWRWRNLTMPAPDGGSLPPNADDPGDQPDTDKQAGSHRRR